MLKIVKTILLIKNITGNTSIAIQERTPNTLPAKAIQHDDKFMSSTLLVLTICRICGILLAIKQIDINAAKISFILLIQALKDITDDHEGILPKHFKISGIYAKIISVSICRN